MTSILSIAPMIDWTNSPFRIFMRMLAPSALLYTEMQTTGAVYNNPKRALHFSPIEHPIALQLGGADAKALAYCASIAEEAGYDEVNLNLGCPSNKVQAGRFGACMMNEPKLVSQCIKAIKQAVNIPVTAKIRIGIDHQDSFEFFSCFAHQLIDSGCDKLIVHARKAWLTGLNPKQNRTIPPVNYDFVYQLKKEIPHIPLIINGNISDIIQINEHLTHVDGVMLGRLACDNPFKIAQIHQSLYPESFPIKPSQVFFDYSRYLLDEYLEGTPLSLLIKPVFNLAHGLPGASLWKKQLMHILQTKNLQILDELTQYLVEIENSVPRKVS